MTEAERWEAYQHCSKWGHQPIIATRHTTGPFRCPRCLTTYTIKIEITEEDPPEPPRPNNEDSIWQEPTSEASD